MVVKLDKPKSYGSSRYHPYSGKKDNNGASFSGGKRKSFRRFLGGWGSKKNSDSHNKHKSHAGQSYKKKKK